ncbi:MAG: ABC transporter permease [Gemmatimonadota bacterium]|jgi:predicted permease
MTRSPGPLHGKRPRVGDLPVEEDVRRELEAHLALRTEELVGQGWSEAEAREEARRLFGDAERIRRECESETRSRDRAVKRAMGWEAGMQDVRYAIRSLVRSPGFALVAVVTLALGIGANSAIFSVLHGVLLKPLPYPDPGRLVWIDEAHDGPGGRPGPVPWPNFRDWRERSDLFDAMTAFGGGSFAVLGGAEPVRTNVALVSEEFWRVLRPEVAMGRFTTPEEHVEGATPSIVVSERFWRQELGADPDVLGRTLEVAGWPAVVVGVVGTGFHFPGDTDIWVPLEVNPQGTSRTAHNNRVVGRLEDGVRPTTADSELDRISLRMVQGLPQDDYDITGAIVTPLREQIAGDTPRALYLLMGAAVLLLLVASTNLASTLLARGVGRSRELAVRSSLGAGRGRLLRLLLTESGVLSVVGAAVGLALAAGLVHVIRTFGALYIPRIDEIGIHPTVVAFTIGVGVLTTLLCGLVPAVRLSGRDISTELRTGSRGNAGARSTLWRTLVGAEVALALVLLVGGGLLVRSFAEILEVDPGFDADGVLSVGMALSSQRYPDLQDYADFYRRLVDELERDPEIEAAAVTSVVPLQGSLATGMVHTDHDPDEMKPAGAYVAVSPDYFETLGIEILRGRVFTDADDASAPHVVVVSEALGQRLWPGEDPIGKVMTGGGMDNYWSERKWAEVVGVVRDVKYRNLTGDVDPAYYFPVYQRPYRTRFGFVTLTRTRSGEAGTAAPIVRETMDRLDPDVPLVVRSMEERTTRSLADRRFVLMVLGGFALTALLLAAVGIYGVVSYLVASRTREMGIRMALGETPASVRSRVVLRAIGMVAGGVLAGGVVALLVGRVVRSFLFGVEPTDPVTLASVVGILALTAVGAAWIPALRATRVDPLHAMRTE